jgi:small basic protein (TIGR04137 family)
MSLDRSLRSASSLSRHRNVLSRGERLLKLAETGKWDESKSPLGLVKVAHRKMAIAGKVKEAPAEGAAAGAAGAPAAAGAAAAPAAGAKGAAPAAAAAGGKGAAAPAAAVAAKPAAGGKKK